MNHFYMVWVAGMRGPNRTYTDVQLAMAEAERLRREATDREVYVLAPTHRLGGRPILPFADGAPCAKIKVGPSITIKKRRVIPLVGQEVSSGKDTA